MLGRSREVALGLKQAGEVVEAKRGIGMVGAERFRDVFRNETPDRAGRVYRGDNLAVGSEDEAGRLQVAGLGVHVGASCGGDRIGVRAEADGIGGRAGSPCIGQGSARMTASRRASG